MTRKKAKHKDTLIRSVQNTRHDVGGGEGEEIVSETRFSHVLEDHGSIEMILFRVDLLDHLRSPSFKFFRVETRIASLHIEDTVIFGHVLLVIDGNNWSDLLSRLRLHRYRLRIKDFCDRQSHIDVE